MPEQSLDDRFSCYNEGFKAGALHATMSPETAREIKELKDEWADMKKLFRTLLITGLITMVGYGAWVGTITVKVAKYEEAIHEGEGQRAEIMTKVQASEIVSAEVRTKLISIEATLLEIKSALKIK